MRKKERIEMAEVRKNVWKKWRGKSKILENKRYQLRLKNLRTNWKTLRER